MFNSPAYGHFGAVIFSGNTLVYSSDNDRSS